MFDDIHRARRAAPSESGGQKNTVLRLLERMHVCVRVQTADFADKRGLVTRRIKASQMLQSIVCAFRSISGEATAEKLVLSH